MSSPPFTFYISGGTLPLSAGSYIVRQADSDLLERLRAGEFCYVLDTRQMGKSSLMVRTARQLQEDGIRIAVLDLTAAGRNLTADQWYYGLLVRISEQLDPEERLPAYWKSHRDLGPMQRFLSAIRDILLVPGTPPLVIFLDEIDAVRSLPFSADELFVGIRECYNRRAREPAFENLTFCLLGVAAPTDLVQDTRLSPFNIGHRIELSDFTPEEAAPLARGFGNSPDRTNTRRARAVLSRILYWTNGHPYMTQRLCRAVVESGKGAGKNRQTASTPALVDRLCKTLFLTRIARESDDNLAFVRNRLLQAGENIVSLLDLYQRLYRGERIRDEESNPMCVVLRLSGIATRDTAGCLRVRNRVYRSVFNRVWVRENLPDLDMRRQREAFRRGAIRATLISAGVVTVLAALSMIAFRNADEARRNAATAQENALRSRRNAQRADANALQAETNRRLASASAKQAEANAASARKALAQAQVQAKRAEAATLASDLARAEAQAQTKAQILARQEAETEKKNAQRNSESEKAARLRALNYLYDANVQLAASLWASADGSAAIVKNLLESQIPEPGEPDLRTFEWYYLWRQVNQSSHLRYAIPSREKNRRTAARFLGGSSREVFFADSPTHAAIITLDDSGVSTRPAPVSMDPAGYQIAIPERYTSSAISWDGVCIAQAQPDGAVLIRQSATGALLHTIPPPAGIALPVKSHLYFVPGMNWLIARFEPARAGTAPIVWTFDLLTGRPLPLSKHTLALYLTQAPAPELLFFAVSPEQRYTAFAADYSQIIVAPTADLDSAPSIDTIFRQQPRLQNGQQVRCVTFSPDCRTLYVGGAFGGLTAFDLSRRQKRWSVNEHIGNVSAIAVSPDGGLVASGDEAGLVHLWDPSGNLVQTFKGGIGSANSLEFSRDGRSLLFHSILGDVRVWNTRHLENSEAVLPTPKSPPEEAQSIVGLGFLPAPTASETGSYERLAVSSVGRDGRFWRIRSKGGATGDEAACQPGIALARPKTDSDPTTYSLAVSPDGRSIATGAGDGAIRLWDSRTGTLLGVASGQNDWRPQKSRPYTVAGRLQFSPDSRFLAVGYGCEIGAVSGNPQRVTIYDTATLKPRQYLSVATGTTGGIAFSPDRDTIALACRDNETALFSLKTGRRIRTLPCPGGATSAAFSPDGAALVIGSMSNTIWVWDTRRYNKAPRELQNHSGRIEDVTFSPDGKTLASVSFDHTVKLWDTRTWQETVSLRSHPSPVYRAAFSPNGALLATGGLGGDLYLWNAMPVEPSHTP